MTARGEPAPVAFGVETTILIDEKWAVYSITGCGETKISRFKMDQPV
jgi:hypothetical protein